MNNNQCPECNKGELRFTSEGLGETWKTYTCGHESKVNDALLGADE